MKTIKEVAEIFKVSEMTIHRWIKAGKLKYSQPFKGASIRITDEEIKRLKGE